MGRNLTVDEYCRQAPDTQGCDTQGEDEDEKPSTDNVTICCQAMTAECLACKRNLTVEEYCRQAPDTQGCETRSPQGENEDEKPNTDDVTVCCQAMTAECLACKRNLTVEGY